MKMNVCIKGVGCDIVDIPRFKEKMKNTRLVDKIFTEHEQKYFANRQVFTAAGLWAAKEAVSKALGTGFVGVTAKDIEIRHNENGTPQIVLYNGARSRSELIDVRNIHVSISHEKEQALAFVVIE